jgi:Zinc-ribbon
MSDYFKRIDSMLALHTMPVEYQNTFSNIYCNDCEKKSVCKYHFLYHKCDSCQGYNSKLISTFERSGEDSGQTLEVVELNNIMETF